MSTSRVILPGLSGRVALVTGANHGIGAATAQELAAAPNRWKLIWSTRKFITANSVYLR